MYKCYKDAKTEYENGKWKNKEDFIQYVWDIIIKMADAREKQNRKNEDHHIVERATKAFLNCYRIKRTPISGTVIFSKTNFKYYDNSKSHGLWPWLSYNADVIKREKAGIYSIPDDDFYHALLKVVLNMTVKSP
jgi:hypothetical protein